MDVTRPATSPDQPYCLNKTPCVLLWRACVHATVCVQLIEPPHYPSGVEMRHKGAGRADSLLPVSRQLALLDSSFSPQDHISLRDVLFYCANAPGQIVPLHVTVETP